MVCIIKWICQESDENVISDNDNNKQKYSTGFRNGRRCKLKGEKLHEKMSSVTISTKSKITTALSKRRRHRLKRKKLSVNQMLYNESERKNTPFTEACEKTTYCLEIGPLLGERRVRKQRQHVYNDLWKLWRCKLWSHSFSYFHVKMNEIICEC